LRFRALLASAAIGAVLVAAPVAAQERVSVSQVRARAADRARTTVVLRATVTRQRQGRSLYVVDETGSLFINTSQRDPVIPGDIVQIVGVPDRDELAPFLESQRYTKVGSGAPPRPRAADAEALLSGARDAELVQVRAQVVGRRSGDVENTLSLRSGTIEFEAHVLKTSGDFAAFSEGSVVQVSGICSMQVGADGRPAGFELLLRDGGDVALLAAAPFWTPRRIEIFGSVGAAVFLLIAGWAVTLRQQVRRQTATIAERLREEAALKVQYQALVEDASDMIYTHDLAGRLTSINAAGELLVGYTRDQCALLSIFDLVEPEDVDRLRDMLDAIVRQQVPLAFRVSIRARNGRTIPVEVHALAMLREGTPVGVQGVARDLTERERLEEDLREVLKMDAVGRLAGGVAHDFNNLLTVVLAYSDLLAGRVRDDHESRQAVEEIQRAASRATALTAQMLAFGRRQFLEPSVVDLNGVVTSMATLLDRACGDEVEVITAVAQRPLPVLIDRGQMEQALVNLAVNASEAMADGGRLTIATSMWRISDSRAALGAGDVALPVGNYARLTVTDTGVGISPDVQKHVFEPFFTTKSQGAGSGLGLSMVHGFVKQSGGHISVRSVPGEGTSFELLFPVVHEEGEEAPQPAPGPSSATIVVAEDDSPVRKLIVDSLRQRHFTVLEAIDGEHARDLVRHHPDRIDVLLADLKMPRLGGIELARWLSFHRPGVRVLFMSGYAVPPQASGDVLGASGVLQKPFTRDELLARILDLLSPSSKT
jgi:PAS domain S-box-containing protein